MDFFTIKERSDKKGQIDVYPDFVVGASRDLMIRGRSFYAIWDEELGLWSTSEFDVQRLVDKELAAYRSNMRPVEGVIISVKWMKDFSSGSWLAWTRYVKSLFDSSHQLDEVLTFANTEVRQSDYVSRRLPYSLEEGSIAAYDEIMSTLYDPEERAKLEWAVGAIVSGDAKYIQKFLVLYGPAGKGKSTFLDLVQKLFPGYYTTFEAKALTSSSNAFSTEMFKTNPLVAIQHDGDLSKIEDNTKLNSIVSHEEMTMNEKFKPSYMARINAFLMMGTNKPVKITDAKSGIIRRLIDVQPTGDTLPTKRYHALKSQLDFELGAIAHHCLKVYREMGRDYYSGYRPVEMMLQTDVFFNYIEAFYDVFSSQEGVGLSQAYEMYKLFCDETNVEYKLARFKFREELKNYFRHFEDRAIIDGVRVRSWYSGFVTDHFTSRPKEEHAIPLVLDHTDSLLDVDLGGQPAQYATSDGIPISKWAGVTTTLAELDTTRVHYVKPPLNHIVIDFDLKGDDGEKSAILNLDAASKFPSTYAEYSQGGGGIHLHYLYEGDVSQLSRVYAEGIEVKVFTGDSSLRRRVSRCNNVPVASISTGLPLKERKMISVDSIKSEKGLREMIERNLNKEIHPGTKPSMDFIHKILEDAYNSGLAYDVSDMHQRIMVFANNSTNHNLYCLKLLTTMKFKSEVPMVDEPSPEDADQIIFDVECFPNLFVVSWKVRGDDASLVSMINPKPHELEEVVKGRLIGFNNRRYDNHMLYAALMGYNNEQLYRLSQKIINNVPNATFGEAYGLSYTDIYDYASKKQSLKKWQIELGIEHKELGLPWDQPVPEELWPLVCEYCENDVVSTEATLDATKDDFNARMILCGLSGLTMNHTTQAHTAKIIFGDDKKPQSKFEYTKLAEMFDGYEFDGGKSTYKGIELGEGGHVYAEPGMYTNVAVLDAVSMHPTSIIQLNLFGPYTKNFTALVKARVAIKHGDFESAGKMLNGALKPYLKEGMDASKLAYALKIVINIVYGLTAAKFDNPFRDNRNVDNIVAKRGALFMVDLKEFIESRGFQVVHIKTDSVKIPNATKEIIDEVMEFGNDYGYEFEHEATFEKFCLVNDAVYVAKTLPGRTPAHWDAVGAQFQHPYVFKTLFSHEPLYFSDYAETKAVTTSLWLDLNPEDKPMALEEPKKFVGKVGRFMPVTKDGGLLYREKDGKYYAATGTKGYRWLEAEDVASAHMFPEFIDMSYFENLVNDAVANISQYGDFEWFTSS